VIQTDTHFIERGGISKVWGANALRGSCSRTAAWRFHMSFSERW